MTDDDNLFREIEEHASENGHRPVSLHAIELMLDQENAEDAILAALDDSTVISSLALAPLEQFLLLCAKLEKRTKVKNVQRLAKAVNHCRRQTVRDGREATEPEATPSKQDELMAAVAEIIDQADARIDNLGDILDELVAYFQRFEWFPYPYQADVVALWTVHTYCLDIFEFSPRLSVRAPTKRCGKSRLLRLLRWVVYNCPGIEALTTAPAVFRSLGEERETFLLDEVDALFGVRATGNEELRAIINHGFESEGMVRRLVPDPKKGYRKELFPAFCAMALTGIGRLPDTVEDRSIIVRLERCPRGTELGKATRVATKRIGTEVAGLILSWRIRHGDKLRDRYPPFPTELNDREEDIWGPLLVLADHAGEEWPERARRAAVRMAGTSDTGEDAEPAAVLAAVHRVFAGKDTISSKDLVAELNGLEDEPWGSWHQGAGIRPYEVGRYLREFGVRTRQTKVNGAPVRVFRRTDLELVWERYLAPADEHEE